MILQALADYYKRKVVDSGSEMPAEGWEWKEIPFLAVVNAEGDFVRFEDTHEQQGEKLRAHRYLVPSLGEKKGNGIKSNLLWENIEYMFGIPVPTKAKTNPDPERVRKQHEVFQARINALGGDGPVIEAVQRFVKKCVIAEVQKDPLWPTLRDTNPNVLLYLEGNGAVTDDPDVRALVNNADHDQEAKIGVCLVSGTEDRIVRLEPPIKGVRGNDRKAERALVSFNIESFNSFHKDQNFNAPIGKSTSFAYAAALNHLLGKDSKQKMPIGDATAIFWAEKSTDFEQQIVDFFGEPPKDDPDRNARAVESLFRAPQSGAMPVAEDKTKFYVLGLAPNASRISIRFWIVNTVAAMSGKIRQHFEDIRIIHGPRDKDAFSLFRMLVCTATQGKAENIAPNLGGDTMRSILEGLPYPQTLLQAAIRRIRAEHEVTHIRAALIKAYLNRLTRFKNAVQMEEIKVSLDNSNTNIGYRLGRLFATLERLQIRVHTQDGGKEPNSTIRDRYYGSASGTPIAAFGTLIRLSKHHLSKLGKPGERVFFEKLFGQIMEDVGDFPAHLKLEDQGRFAIGYYHQMQDFFLKKS